MAFTQHVVLEDFDVMMPLQTSCFYHTMHANIKIMNQGQTDNIMDNLTFYLIERPFNNFAKRADPAT